MIRALITLFVLGVVAVFMAAILSGRRKPPSPPIRGAALLFAALLCGGCATNGVKQDDFPDGVPCVQARNDAVQWYKATRHQEPSIRPTRVIVTPDPPDGYGGVTSGSGGGFLIRIWEKQNPFYGSLVHEFRHTMPGCLSEEATR